LTGSRRGESRGAGATDQGVDRCGLAGAIRGDCDGGVNRMSCNERKDRWIRCLFLAAFLALWSFLAALAIAHLAPDTPYLIYAIPLGGILIRLGGLMVLFHLSLGEAVLFSILASIVSMGIGRGLSFALSKLPLFGAGLLRT
jgi:hypothetical protein